MIAAAGCEVLRHAVRRTTRRTACVAGCLAAVVMLAVASAFAAQPVRLEPIFPPADLHGVHGLAFDESGRLIAAETWGMAIHRLDPASGRLETLVPPPFGASDDVGIVPAGHPFAGTLVWSANLEGKVMARDPDGRIRVLASELPGINTIAVSASGQLLATQTGPVNRLLEIDPAGVAPARVILSESGGLNGFAITPDGTIVGPQQDPALRRIVRIDAATGRIDVVSTGLVWPTGVKQARNGSLYGVDLGSGILFRLDPATGSRITVARFEPGLDNLAIAPDGHIYVSHIPTSSIYAVDPRTSRVRPVVRGRFGVPGGMACVREEGSDVLYLADLFTLKRIDVARREIKTLVALDRDSPFPSNVTVRGDHLIASSLLSGRVAVYDRRTGKPLRTLSGFKAPRDAVELVDGRLLVAETGTGSLVVVDADDRRSALPVAAAQFSGLNVAADGRIYVTAPGLGQLQRLDPSGHFPEVIADALGSPEGLAFDSSGNALVIDRTARVLRSVDLRSGKVRVLATDLPLGLGAPAHLLPAKLFHGVAASDCRAIYVSSDRDGTIYRVRPAPRRN